MRPIFAALRDTAVVAVVLLSAYGGYTYGHQEGMQDSETAAMQSFMDKCVQPEPPAMCDRMLDAVWGPNNYTGASP